jgi:hypothetical protein
VRAQRQVHPEHKAVLGGVAHQGVDDFDGLAKVFLVGNTAPAVGHASGVAVQVVDVDQVDVAGHVELARAQLAHAHHPQLRTLALRAQRRAVLRVQQRLGVAAGGVQGDFGQLGDSLGHHLQRGLAITVQAHQALHHQLAQGAQGGTELQPLAAQGGQSGLHAGTVGRAGGQQLQLAGIAAAQPLHKTGMAGQGLRGGLEA